MKVVVASDSFKESLTAKQASEAIKTGLSRVWKDAEIVTLPVADGGEGTMNALLDATNGRQVLVEISDPLGKPIRACYGILGDGQTAVVEMAQASGLHLVPVELRDPKQTSSFGTGQLILHALNCGIRRFIIGLGGSATNDAGIGMLAALGMKFFDASGMAISANGIGLTHLAKIDASDFDPRLADCEVLVASDVDTLLCGTNGASVVFGPQKGATSADVELLDSALRNFGELTEQLTGKPVSHQKGSGAAGGMGAAFLGYFSANLKPGIEIVIETVRFVEHLADADFVFTGEGCLDGQTIHGKTALGIAKAAKQFNIPVIALAGCTGEGFEAVYEFGIDAVFSAVPRAMNLTQAINDAEANLTQLAENVARLLLINTRK
ncbi:glycerate kinase [Vibrio azureus]|uniref:Glycerate kinase GlxK n=1 Tax=Vibrio azureus NBRC 104587 TaxID=1219077 RepID=U3AUN1_9VIBR|nr:glycerate kinase [Vibrio azureus]AUI88666.1 glycerate kinase [Vibrio azureus]GAD76952.1 glycerate kinase GlxK [Vibrio azureus NBRC 104587]